MAMIQVENLTFEYENSPDAVFENLSFRLDTDWKLGLIARNGKGKTTLLKLLAGEISGQGKIFMPVAAEYFPPVIKERERLTIDVVEKLEPEYELWKVCRECSLMELDAEILYRPFRTLSNGEQTKILLAVLFARESAFLLLDEPTNHLDEEARKAIARYLKKKKGFLLVSHDRMLLDACIDHVMAMNRQTVEIRQGNFSEWWRDKENRDAFERKENEKLKKEIGHLRAASRQSGFWADAAERTKIGHDPYDSQYDHVTRAYIGEKSRKLQMRRKSMEKRMERAIEEKKGLLKNIEETENLKLFPLSYHKEVLAAAKDCTLIYAGKTAVNGITFSIRRGEKLFLNGKNGSGKSSVIKAVLGQEEPAVSAGSLWTAPGLIISYVPQDASFLEGRLEDYAKGQKIDRTAFLTLLRKLDFSREMFAHKMEDFSAGQKKKVLLAASMCKSAHLYIWDEPLNYIDVFSRMQIESLLNAYGFTLLAVEHDKAFREAVGGREIWL